MNRIVVCLDCPHYQKGGYCTKTRKDVGALTPACDKAPNETEDLEPTDDALETPQAPDTKKCERCGEVLPLTSFGWINTKTGRRKRRICQDCYHEVMVIAHSKDKKAPGKASEGHKICNICHKELPLSAFGVNKATKDGLMPCCKECKASVQKKYRERMKTATERQKPTGRPKKVTEDPETKRCPKCGRDLPRSAFHPKPEAKSGLQSYCKECSAKAKKKPSKPKTTMHTMNTQTPTPAPVLNEGIATMKTDKITNPFDAFKDHQLADELRARGYYVKAEKTVTITL